MAIAFGSESHVTPGVVANATPLEPSGAVVGDFFLGLALTESAAPSLTRPTGWTVIPSASGLAAGAFRYDLSWIVRGASAPALTWTCAAVYREAFVLRLTGVDTTNPIDSSAVSTIGTLNNPDPPSTTAVDAAAFAVAVAIGWNGSATAWAHAVYTIRSNNAAGNDGIMATRQLSASGAENPAAFTGSGGVSGATWGCTVTLLPAGGGPPPPTTQQNLTLKGVGS